MDVVGLKQIAELLDQCHLLENTISSTLIIQYEIHGHIIRYNINPQPWLSHWAQHLAQTFYKDRRYGPVMLSLVMNNHMYYFCLLSALYFLNDKERCSCRKAQTHLEASQAGSN